MIPIIITTLEDLLHVVHEGGPLHHHPETSERREQTYLSLYIYVYVCIYIYIEREMYTCVCTYAYIYI